MPGAKPGDHRPQYRAVPVVLARRRNRREQDRRRRRRRRPCARRAPAGNPARVKTRVRSGTMIIPPPTPSSPARKPTTAPSDAGRRRPATHPSSQQSRFASLTTNAHSAGSTGVIDSRLPRCRMRIRASSGCARSSASGTNRGLLDQRHVDVEPARRVARRLRVEVRALAVELRRVGIRQRRSPRRCRRCPAPGSSSGRRTRGRRRCIWSRMKLRAW